MTSRIRAMECPAGACRRPGLARGVGRALALGFLSGLLCATAVASLAARVPEAPAPAADTVRVPPWPVAELPREWRWERKAIRFDPMFRRLR